MSEFQTSLLLIGAVVIVGVFAYNKWQEQRANRAAEEAFKSPHDDVLIGEGALRPRPSAGLREVERTEPGLAPRPLIAADRPVGDGSATGTLESRVDYMVELAAEQPIAGSIALERWIEMEHRFAQRATLTGLIGDEWIPLKSGVDCEKLRAALQLVSRAGVVSESELLEFRSAIETLASRLGATAHASEMREALEAARELDAVCVEADIQIAFHVVATAGTSMPGTKLRALAEASGFVLGKNGCFALHDDHGRELYALSDRSGSLFDSATIKNAAPQALTLSMDVPRVPDTQRSFAAMIQFGRKLAASLGGALVDDNNQTLDDRAVSAINTQLTVVQQALGAQGIAPGSTLALRLFS